MAPLATDAEEDNLGPAALHALDVLGWRELCAEVERFASTVAGREAVRRMLPGRSSAKAEGLLAETVAVDAIEALHGAALQFGGVETGLAVPALRRAEAAGLLSGAELLAVASVLAGAGRLARWGRAGGAQWQRSCMARAVDAGRARSHASYRGSMPWPSAQVRASDGGAGQA